MKKVAGCGIDIEETVRFKSRVLAGTDASGFAELVYTPSEIERNSAISPAITFPLCFSCKEAFFKAFGVSWTNSRINWKDIELLFNSKDDLNDYSVRLSGYADELFHEKECLSFETSLDYNDIYVLFQVVLLS